MRYGVIMAGGSGTRLWPLSRRGMPKQLLRLIDGKSLLRLAYERLAGYLPDEQIYVCTGADYLDTVASDLPELPRANLLGEPIGRDSLNAVSWPVAVLAERDPDAVVAIVSSDQIITPRTEFRAALETGFAKAEADPDAMIVFGVVPTEPNTGYGYLRHGPETGGYRNLYELDSFTEKPDRATAERYLDSGEYWWNAGMFVWRARTLLRQLELLLPDQHRQVTELARRPERIGEIYPTLPRISIDYAVMEPVSAGRGSGRLFVVRMPITWHDVGGYPALRRHLHSDDAGNVVIGLAQIGAHTRDNLVVNTASDGRLVAVVGLSGTAVVETPDVTLVCPLAEADLIKEMVARVGEEHGDRFA